MKPHGRSDDSLPTCADTAYAGEPASAPAPPKKWQRLGRNFAGAIAAFKNTLSLDGGGLHRDPSPRAEKPPPLLLRGLAQLYSRGAANQQLPEKLVADLRRHFDALPNRSVSQSNHLFSFVFFLLLYLVPPNSATKEQTFSSFDLATLQRGKLATASIDGTNLLQSEISFVSN
jgi:hypothetical protein